MVAEVVGKWVWLDVSPSRKPNLAALLWALGFHWNKRRGVWQHPCGSFDPLGSYPTDPRAKYRSYFPADVLPACERLDFIVLNSKIIIEAIARA
jgi:hypothetical protein